MTDHHHETVRLESLPAQPTGWTKQVAIHLNFGGGQGAATYSIHDQDGRQVEGIGFGYNTKENWRGFFLTDDGARQEERMTWSELRAAYAQSRVR